MQSKEEFLENVQYHADSLKEYTRSEREDAATNHPVDLDPELKAIFDECERHQSLMLKAAVRLAQRCCEKLERNR